MFKKVKALLTKHLSLSQAGKPKIFSSDVFLVSYPKSGNTWLSFILANLLKQNKDEIIDFYSVVRYIPELEVHSNHLSQCSHPRVIKSHQLYNKGFPKVIYCVRDGRDVYVSYYHHLKKRLPVETSFSEFLRKQDLYPSRWHTHVNSWIKQSNILLVIKYEDLLRNPYNEVDKINRLVYGSRFNEEEILNAIEWSSFENMKRLEFERGRAFKSRLDAQKATTFVRKGIQGDWKNYFSTEDENFFMLEAGSTLESLGYLDRT